MIRLVRDFRLIPVVLSAIICLFALKTFGLILNGGYTLNELAAQRRDDAQGRDDVTGSVTERNGLPAVGEPVRGTPSQPANQPARPPAKPAAGQSWAQQMFNFPDVTGSVTAPKPEPKAPAPPAPKGNAPAAKAGDPPTAEPIPPPPSRAERALLERLQERRIELDARTRDIEMRESLLKAAEKRLESRMLELKDVESRATTAVAQKDEVEAVRLKNLVTIYENMKAKDAAKIFDRLDLRVLMDVATQINPRRMSDILAQMTPESAERLTVEFAIRAKEKGQPAELPKIEGRPPAR
jgi:flagellar motility protein MotE (MotC chaperone)